MNFRNAFFQSTIAIVVAFIVLVSVNGCVPVQPGIPTLEINDLSTGQAAVFIAVTDDLPSTQLEVRFSDQYSCFLKANAINKLYLPEDWYTMQLTRLPQSAENAAIRHRFTAGEIMRFVLVLRTEDDESESDSQQTSQTPAYAFAASTRFGFDMIQQQNAYEIVTLVPQKSSESPGTD